MKNILTFVFLLCLCAVYGQQQPHNLILLDQLEYNAKGNDVWGYVAPDGTEYALMGLVNGTSIVSLEDPSNVAEVWNNHAYVSNESVGTIAIIDLNNLPTGAPFTDFQLEVNGAQIQDIHNLYIDENGYLYIAGSNLNGGGVIIYDLNNNPKNPVFAGTGAFEYAHDVYVRDNKMYTSDIYAGAFTVYDVSDKSNVTVLASQSTPFNFTHNAWLSDNDNTLFTTDERRNAYTVAYDISDLDDIKELDRFRPLATEGHDVIPHNVHVKDGFLVISHYTDGIIIVDANKPDNLVEVGNYDTYDGDDGGFSGCWGAFPFFASGIILASNLEGSLDVLQPTYVRACYLEGKITDANTGASVFGAEVIITSTNVYDTSDPSGDYAVGYATAGTYEVTYSYPAYFPQTVSVSLVNGEITVQDVALIPRPSYSFSGQVLSADDGSPIGEAAVHISSPSGNYYDFFTDASGNFNQTVLSDTYEVYAGKWSFKTKLVSGQAVENATTLTVALDRGFRDEFILDLGWTVTNTPYSNEFRGAWEIGEPIGTDYYGQILNADFDLPDDLGDYCYMTGNNSDAVSGNVDYGVTTLTSPVIDMSNMQNPTISYYTWFTNISIPGGEDDMLQVRLTDGTTIMILESITTSAPQWNPKSVIRVKDYFPNPKATMQVIFETSDKLKSRDLVEAAVDLFEAYNDDMVGIENTIDESISMTAFPNPFDSELTVSYTLDNLDDNTSLEVRNTLGQLVYRADIGVKQGAHVINTSLEAGIYFVQIANGNALSAPLKVVKW